jgi:hypothetical protein
MHVLHRDDLKELIQVQADHFVSLFMPTHRTGRERQQDPVRLKNLLKQAEDELVEQGLSAQDAGRLLAPAQAIQSDELFWRDVSDGLAVYCGGEFFRYYRLPLRLDEHLVVNRRQFYLKPLLPLLNSNGRFYVLALSQDRARLYEATRYSIRKVPLPDITRAPFDGDDETLQYHSHRAPTSGKGNTSEAIYHGHGGPDDRIKEDLAKFFQAVNRAVRGVLQNDQAPLVLACVGYLAPLYTPANSYSHLVSGKVPGSPDMWTEEELRDRAWQFVEPVFRKQQQNAMARLEKARGSGLGSEDLEEVIAAAGEGRVETLFVAEDQQRWGDVDGGRGSVRAAHNGNASVGDAGGVELLDYVAAQTLVHSGDVFAMPSKSLPTDSSPVAATFRYPSAARATKPTDAAARERSTARQHAAGKASG